MHQKVQKTLSPKHAFSWSTFFQVLHSHSTQATATLNLNKHWFPWFLHCTLQAALLCTAVTPRVLPWQPTAITSNQFFREEETQATKAVLIELSCGLGFWVFKSSLGDSESHWVRIIYYLLLFLVCLVRSEFSQQRLILCPLQWKHGVLTTGLPGNFPELSFKK